MMHHALVLGVLILLIVAILELWWPKLIQEGFETLEGVVSVGDSPFWASMIPRRGDIGPDGAQEEKGYIRDDRYFNGYADVQRLGVKHDYCRMLQVKDHPDEEFFACALGGTDGLSSTRYRTKSTRHGFRISRDDYMNDLGGGRDSYCRILKVDENTYHPMCNLAEDQGFRDSLSLDSNPPEKITELLRFYEGIQFWLRFRDDMVDYADNLVVFKAGDINIDEFPPNPRIARTLQFNGVDQYLRIGDNKQLSFGSHIDLRYMRAVSFWVYFEEFTNNAHIFDFGNGAGRDNVFMGIIGRGNAPISAKSLDQLLQCGDGGSGNTVPAPPSGAQPAEIVTPEVLMETTPANVNDYTCPKPEIYGRIMPPLHPKAQEPHDAKSADMVYEIWDHQQRKLHVQVGNAFSIRKWTFVTVTATNNDAARPDLDFYINGKKVYTEYGGWLPQETYTTSNYLGKSNWTSVTSKYENADELFKGNLFDFRGYRLPMNEAKIKATYNWGRKMLGLMA